MLSRREKKLGEFWTEWFQLVDKAKGGEGGGDDGDEPEVIDDPKKAGIAKDDKAKEEAKAQEEMKAINELTAAYDRETIRTAFWKFIKLDDPDTVVLRFMRARKWDVKRALGMFAGCVKWRLDNKVEALLEAGDEGNAAEITKFLEQQESGKTYAFGASKIELPSFYIHVRKHFTKGQPPETMHKYIPYAMESFRLLLVPPNDKVILFFDLNKFGLSNMDWGALLYVVKCLEAYFPESLHTLVIYKAPWIFSGIWKILSPLLDPVVRSKVVFMSKPEECAHLLPADRLIAELGGSVDYDFTKAWRPPRDGENKVDAEERKKREAKYMELAGEYEKITKKWAEGDSGKENLQQRLLLVKKLRVAQFEKEPFVRGKTQIHRDATIDGQGIVTWLYKQTDGSAVRHIVGRKHCVATLKREIKEIEEDKSSVEDAEKKTDQAIEKSDWVTLYGSEEVARKIEGVRVDGKTPEEGFKADEAITVVGVPAGTLAGPAEGKTLTPDEGGPQGAATSSGGKAQEGEGAEKKEEAAAGGAAAGAGAGAAAATTAAAAAHEDKEETQDFHDAPVADKKTVQKAESRDHIAKPQDAEANDAAAAATSGHPTKGEEEKSSGANGTSAANGNADSSSKGPSDYGNSNGSSNGKEKLKQAGSTLGRRFSKLVNKATPTKA